MADYSNGPNRRDHVFSELDIAIPITNQDVAIQLYPLT